MPTNFATILVWATGGAVFVLVASIWMMMTLGLNMRRAGREEKLARRLEDVRRGRPAKTRTLRLWHDGKEGTTVVSGVGPGSALGNFLTRLKIGLGWKGPLASFAAAVGGGMISGALITYTLTENVILSALWFVLVPMILNMISMRRAAKAEEVFERQFADALSLATRSLRAGHPLMSAFQVIVEEMEPPVSTVFAEILQEQGLGIGLEEAIETAAEKSASQDMKLFAASTVIQLRSGGNLADMMDRLVDVIRDRMRLQRRVRVLTAQTQLSKRVLMFIPLALFLMLLLTKPGYLEPLWKTQVGLYLCGTAVAFMIVGSWIMNRIARLKY